ncbi:hypothetical protein GLW08_21310 [Pontibacillus yanchengensis]|uniref:Uncharacterized protein n=2 Tax=Pontibacillus yanchengensis TaxID=462910 RepID=A0A6I5A518_9BACI|nr:hypothetical protein [Pontibacillus yanchengensis]MYL35423.1 hypothetical protein [Pontibacillus yanchengensis]MYL55842.1 hypothetical protein [Pontibacillus yanchengensis]
MEWERCIRCESNRVVKRQTVLFPAFLLLVGAAFLFYGTISLFGLASSTSNPILSTENTFENVALVVFFFLFGIGLFQVGRKWLSGSERLFCKDCEVAWKANSNR